MILFSFFFLQANGVDEEKRQSLLDLVTQGGPLGIAIVSILLVLSKWQCPSSLSDFSPLKVPVKSIKTS